MADKSKNGPLIDSYNEKAKEQTVRYKEELQQITKNISIEKKEDGRYGISISTQYGKMDFPDTFKKPIDAEQAKKVITHAIAVRDACLEQKALFVSCKAEVDGKSATPTYDGADLKIDTTIVPWRDEYIAPEELFTRVLKKETDPYKIANFVNSIPVLSKPGNVPYTNKLATQK